MDFFLSISHLIQISSRKLKRKSRQEHSFDLIRSTFASPPKSFARQFPLIYFLHGLMDGALMGVLIAVIATSSLALHWQSLWTVALSKLETTRDLTHRFRESTAIIERHLLEENTLPLAMVPTKASNLLYLERPIDSDAADQTKSLNKYKINSSKILLYKGY